MRIDKFICDSINITRTQAKKIISLGSVYVDGTLVRSGSQQVDENHSNVTIDGTSISYNRFVYIMMNKPKGVLSATKDNNCKTAIDLLNESDRRHDLFIAGRLDKNTTGLLLITNDGKFAHDILSPKKHVIKTYHIILKDKCDDYYGQAFNDGIVIDDNYKCKPAEFIKLSDYECILKIQEGKFHQIKRMFESFGNKVVELDRTSMGNLTLDNTLKHGEYRYLTDKEIKEFVNKITKNTPETIVNHEK